MSVKISALPNATVPLAGTEKLAIVQSGVTKKVDASALNGINRVVFITDGSGAATVAALIGKAKGTDFDLFEYGDSSAGTLLGIDLYGFNSGTGELSSLSSSTKYLVYYV